MTYKITYITYTGKLKKATIDCISMKDCMAWVIAQGATWWHIGI